MDRIRSWLETRFAERPGWMNALLVFCAFMTFIYVPWDFLFKPPSEDQEAWFGILLHGRAAKLTEPLHLAIYAAGTYGFWKMRPWMWPWAAVYAGSVTFGMLVWGVCYRGGFGGFLLGLAAAVPLGLVTRALWNAREDFEPKPLGLRERYGDWALVTGASAGIGAEFARTLAREGVNCVLTARRKDRLEELAAELEKTFGIETRVIVANLATVRGADQVAKEVGDLDLAIVVNNAGVGYAGRFEKQDVKRLRDMVTLNCTTPVVLTSRLLPALIERRRGAIIMVGSSAGRQPLPLLAVYSATKSFDNLFGEALWAELRERGIDVVTLMPGPVATEFEQVAGELRTDPAADELPEDSVRIALEALGKQASVVSGSWWNWGRANANRFVPRSVMALLAADFVESQTPPDMR